VLRWIRSYLTDRYQKVVLGGDESNTIRCASRISPGPTALPYIYIDDVIKVPLSVGSKLVLYADDMLLYRKIDRPEDYTMLQKDINTINNWVKDNSLTFNVS